MTRSRSTSSAGSMSLLQPAGCPRKGSRPLVLLLLLGLLSGSLTAWAQPPAGVAMPKLKAADTVGLAKDSGASVRVSASAAPAAKVPAVSAPVAQAPAAPIVAASPAAPTVAPSSSNWSTIVGVLFGVAIGVLGAWLWARRASEPSRPVPQVGDNRPAPSPAEAQKKPAQNAWKSPSPPTASATAAPDSSAPGVAPSTPVPEKPARNVSVQSMREAQGNASKNSNKPTGSTKKSKPNFNSRPSAADTPPGGWPSVPHRPATMNPNAPTPPPPGSDQPLETGQTIEWPAPTSTPPAIQEMIAAGEPSAAVSQAASEPSATAPAAANGPLHYYAPAPDVPSIEHRKLSPNPLPQMPVLITLPHAAAETAQFSFSPQADQSRIIGNGVRELKEFFQFELPPTEQFTTIKNLKPGKLEKRDDAWHVVQKAEIALS